MESILDVLSMSYGIFRLDACLLGIAVCLFVSWWLNRLKYNYPPGPWVLPIIGHVTQPRLNHRRQIYSEWAKKYGDIVMTKMAVGHLVILHSLPLMKEAFVDKASEFSDRPSIGLQASRSQNKGVIYSNGEYWRKHRKFSLGALRSLGGLGTNKMEESIMEEARYLVEAIEKTNGQPIDLCPLLGNAVSNVICNVVFGCRYDYDDPEFTEVLSMINDLVRLTSGELLPAWIQYLPFVSRAIQKNIVRINAIKAFVGRHIDEHRATVDPNNPRDLIDAYLSEFLTQNAEYDESDLRAMVIALFIAGTETTSGTLYWSHLFMANHTDVQRKVHEEIDDVVGRDRLPCYSDIDKLTYTEATVLEIQRKGCIVPGVLPHFNQNPAKIGGYDIPAQSVIDINIFHLMFNPDLWEKPETFNPSRFVDAEGHISIPEYFLPFGIGPRICLGRKLAVMEMAIFFTQIIQNFEIRHPEGVGPISEKHYGSATLAPERYKVCFIKRSTL